MEESPSDAGGPTSRDLQERRNSPASPVCLQADLAQLAEQQQPAADASPATPQAHLEPPVDGEDNTPRSEDPSADGPPGLEHHDRHPEGFFALAAANDAPPPHLSTASATASFVEPASSHDAAISHLDLTNIAPPSHRKPPQPDHHYERPTPQHTYSNTSTTSTATVRASDYMPPSARPSTRPHSTHPQFPNQAHSALHAQQHPTPHQPPQLRTRNSNPSPYLSYVAAANKPKDFAPTPSGSRTAGNSPSSSPGLFTPGSSPNRPRSVHDDQPGTYSSPFLHYTQRTVPKETHVADIDVDPVSGRKIINQYEIIDELGRGVHGKVKLGRILPGGDYVAIKIVERYSKKRRLGKSNNHEDKIKKEIAILKKARHQNIVSLLEVIDDPAWKKVYIVLEFVELGEVAWRTHGKEEICLIEYRRHLRESNGIEQDEAAAEEEARILQDARIKREKERKRRVRRELRGRAKDQSGPWSFEHQGEDTEDEDEGSDGLSLISTHSSKGHRVTLSHGDANSVAPANHHTEPDNPSIPEDTSTADFATITSLDTVEAIKQPPEDTEQCDELATLTVTGLEGTMYGSYDPDIPRGRTPSIADSVGSRFFEDPYSTHVPEHFKWVPLLTLNQARSAFRDTVLGLEYLHFQGVIHRDIKPANLLQTRDHRIKISDFGVSYLGRERGKAENPDQSESEVPDIDEAIELAKTVGTPAFYAPELCQTDADDDEPTPPVTQQIDVWALGVTLYCLVFGRVPFHDHNPFVLMAKISDEEVHIPRRRLRAVDEHASSRPDSRGRMFGHRNSNKRAPHDLEYEEIDEDLYDLLRRLFIKDPRRRIKLTEVKHHPWVLAGISNPVAWLEDTDPGRSSGTKIIVSKEDVADAVVPLNIVERTLSSFRKLGEKLGLGRSSSTRSRAKSSATNPEASNISSAASSSSTISQDGRRASAKIDETVWALRARDSEHPLAQSETASPEAFERAQYFSSVRPLPTHSEPSEVESEHLSERIYVSSTRPQVDRAASTSATTKTIRQKDLSRSLGIPNLHMGNLTFPALPSTPKSLEPPATASLGGIFGAGRKIMNSVRSRDRTADRDPDGRARLSDRGSADSLADAGFDPHAEPSLGLSKTVAAGLLRQPEPPHSNPSSAAPSPVSSRAASITSPDQPLSQTKGLSRHSSISSTSSARRRPLTASRSNADPSHPHRPSDLAEEHDRAREEFFRRRIAEEERPPSANHQRPQSVLSQNACPPSPDDEIFYRRQHEEPPRSASAHYDPPSTHGMQFPPLPPGRLDTSSSEDQLTSGLSQSTSNPSIPSVNSADSSIVPESEEVLVLDLSPGAGAGADADAKDPSTDPPSDSSTVHSHSETKRPHHHEDDEGYAGDAAVESNEESDSDDSFIEISRRKGRGRQPGLNRTESVGVGELGHHRATRAAEIKSGRSESNGTMKKVRTRSLSRGEKDETAVNTSGSSS